MASNRICAGDRSGKRIDPARSKAPCDADQLHDIRPFQLFYKRDTLLGSRQADWGHYEYLGSAVWLNCLRGDQHDPQLADQGEKRLKKQNQLVIITGMSGAGKSLAANTFEDLNFHCIDNLPPGALPNVIDFWKQPAEPQNVAIVVDVRAGQFFEQLLPICRQLKEHPVQHFQPPVILFLDSSDAELVKRFKETRRKHPLVTEDRGILEAIALERTMLADLKENADKIIDATNLEPEGLRRLIRGFFGPSQSQERLTIAVLSFGFKHGTPLDADVVFDVRFLANPFWVPGLRNLNGTHDEVAQYVLSDPLTEPLLEKLFDLVEFSLPQYIKEGKAYLTIAIGCTGGKHRSVVVANELARFLSASNYTVRVEHRDLMRTRGQTDAR